MAEMRDYLREHYSFKQQIRKPEAILAYSNIDLDDAVERLLAYKASHPAWHGTDLFAANHVVYRRLLRHADMQAYYVAEGKWVDYLAARVPEYARYSGEQVEMRGLPMSGRAP